MKIVYKNFSGRDHHQPHPASIVAEAVKKIPKDGKHYFAEAVETAKVDGKHYWYAS
jgi:hypothetical protein